MNRAIGLFMVFLGTLLSSRPVGAGPAEGRLESFRARLRQWCDLRKQVVTPCRACGGTGRQCKASCSNGLVLNEDRARQAYFAPHTPAWHAIPEKREAMEARIATWKSDPARVWLAEYGFSNTDTTVVGSRWAQARIHEVSGRREEVNLDWYWVLAPEPGRPEPRWFLHDTDVDGLFGDEGPPRKRPAVVENALRWLAAHRSESGGWEADGFAGWCDGKRLEGPPPLMAGRGKPEHNVGITGLALLAFLRAGHTSAESDDLGKIVAGGLRYLLAAQEDNGCFGGMKSDRFLYSHAIATMAMIEGWEADPAGPFLPSARRGVAFLLEAQNPGGAWRYGIRPKENDTSITGWAGQALHAARSADMRARFAGRPEPFGVPSEVFDGIESWLEQMTDSATGRVGYQVRGSDPARPVGLEDKFPGPKSESLTAMALLLRLLRTPDFKSGQITRQQVQSCRRLVPTWNVHDGSIDMVFWYFGTVALRRADSQAWRQWSMAMKSAAMGSQEVTGDVCGTRGSWPPLDPWSAEGGRVYSTAIMTLSLLECAD